MPRSLVITADDFGLSHGVNLAVEKAWKEGILTSASLMTGGAAFGEALEISARNPGLQISLHLTLVQGRSVLQYEQIPGLVDRNGRFTDNPYLAGMRYFFDRGLRSQLRDEIEAQIKMVIDSGINLTHIDGHLNIHMHPTVFSILAELMPAYGIRSFRLSRERLSHNLLFDKNRLIGKSIENFIFTTLAENCRPLLDRLGITYAVEVKGLLSSGRMTRDYITAILDDIQEGTTELYFHPGILPDKEITERMPDYRHEDELAAMTDPLVMEKIGSSGITLANYRGEKKEI